MNLHSKSLDVVSAVGSASKVRKVKLDLVPTFVQPHRHSTDEWLHTRGGLIVGGSESTPNIFVVQHLHFEGEVFLQLNKKAHVRF